MVADPSHGRITPCNRRNTAAFPSGWSANRKLEVRSVVVADIRRYRRLAFPGWPESIVRLHTASTMRWTVMTLTPVSAAMARKLRPFPRSASTRQAVPLPWGVPTSCLVLWRGSDQHERAHWNERPCLAIAARTASTASRRSWGYCASSITPLHRQGRVAAWPWRPARVLGGLLLSRLFSVKGNSQDSAVWGSMERRRSSWM